MPMILAQLFDLEYFCHTLYNIKSNLISHCEDIILTYHFSGMKVSYVLSDMKKIKVSESFQEDVSEELHK